MQRWQSWDLNQAVSSSQARLLLLRYTAWNGPNGVVGLLLTQSGATRGFWAWGGVPSCGCARNAGTSDVLRRTQPASGTPLPAPCLLPWARVGMTLWDSLSSCLALLIPPRKRFKTVNRGGLELLLLWRMQGTQRQGHQ